MQIRFPPILAFVLFIASGLSPCRAYAIETSAAQAIVIDYESGAVLYEKNADQKMPTSSMSKVMSMLLVFDALKEGQLSLEDTLIVSEKAWRKQGSKMFVEVGKEVKVEDLIRGVIVQSGNDATIVLAEGLAGTEEAFADFLNKKAVSIGMENSHFVNASGWPDPDHYSTARDLAIMAKHLIENYPKYYTYYAEEEFTYNDIKQGNRNPLLYRDIGADGIKTGHTEDGGYGLIASGVRDDRRVIVVVNGLESAQARAEESATLLGWGLQSFTNKVILKPGDIVEQVPVTYGVEPKLGVTVGEPVKMTVPKLSTQENWETKTTYDAALTAPVKKGQRVGTVEVNVPGIGTVQKPLVAANDVEKLGFFWLMVEKLRMLVMGE